MNMEEYTTRIRDCYPNVLADYPNGYFEIHYKAFTLCVLPFDQGRDHDISKYIEKHWPDLVSTYGFGDSRSTYGYGNNLVCIRHWSVYSLPVLMDTARLLGVYHDLGTRLNYEDDNNQFDPINGLKPFLDLFPLDTANSSNLPFDINLLPVSLRDFYRMKAGFQLWKYNEEAFRRHLEEVTSVDELRKRR